jgi:hypothetical protein
MFYQRKIKDSGHIGENQRGISYQPTDFHQYQCWPCTVACAGHLNPFIFLVGKMRPVIYKEY